MPRKLVVVAPLTGPHPVVSATCPPLIADECAFRIGVYQASGAIPHPSADTARAHRGAKRAALLGSARLVLRPGHKGVLRITLTAAGRHAVNGGRRIRVRVLLVVRYDGKVHSVLFTTTLGPPKHRRARLTR